MLNTTPDGGVLGYDEGIFIGYGAWERSAAAPRYPFGHGSGYTSWEYERITVEGTAVHVTVRNSGARAGREVVQIYVAPVLPDPDRPARWLAGFATAEAAPGESVTVTAGLPARAFQVWDSGWRTVGGQYLVQAAHSIADRRLSAAITIS